MTIKALDYSTAIAASSIEEISLMQQRVAIAKCAELAALTDRHTTVEQAIQ